ncbi:hypothetical protein G5714_000106 [Onychostoma macrolepis]|uniref:Uncharacterized protein n=1 Tax=Onychostoma macrolepis TaxID=369639 RepID=A0A7J6DGE0_9TELE|nr:hypothetical protein G5714_000106 [Onychostoma macrolepis]
MSLRCPQSECLKHTPEAMKVADKLYDMFQTQYTLYSQAYQHKIGNISQKIIIDALLEAKDKLPKISPIAVSKLQDDIERKIQRITGASSDTHEDDKDPTLREMREFAKLTDHIFEEILYSTDVGLEGARKKLEDVVKRRLPKCVGETRLIKREKHAHKKALNQALQVSSLLPEAFTEHVGRVYYTKNSDEEEDAKECFHWWRRDKCKILVYDQKEFRSSEQSTYCRRRKSFTVIGVPGPMLLFFLLT